MGYRSDVVLMAVFANAEQHDEVMAVYRMHEYVQKHDLEKAWRRVDFIGGTVVRIYEGNGVKWHEGYEDVQGLGHMCEVLDAFHENRGFNYAWGHARVGEEDSDITYDTIAPDNNDLIEVVYDGLRIERTIRTAF